MTADQSDPEGTSSTDPQDETEPGDDGDRQDGVRDPTPPSGTEGFGIANRVMEVWEDVIADMEATAAAYREEGWEVLEIHPGDVAAPDGQNGGRWGLDVLVPNNEFAELEQVMEGESFASDASEVYRATAGGLVLLVVAVLDHDAEVVVLVPAYYDVDQARSMLDRATDEGEIHTHLRPLDLENVVTFTHDDPSIFMAPARGDGQDTE